jgi:bifunctional non-homologous end joining protein LigD
MMVFDLDPGPPATIVECCEVALMIRDRLARDGLRCFPKTSGSKGLQLYAPLNTPVEYDGTKTFAHDLAKSMEAEHSDLVVSNMRKDLRPGRVLMDWSQNDYRKTTVCVYSLRARSHPTVSTPLEWEEVEATTTHRDPERLMFDWAAVLDRVERLGDLFEPVIKLRQKLP